MAKIQGNGWLQLGNSALQRAGISAGDKVRIRADGRGRIVIECESALEKATPADHVDTFDKFLADIDGDAQPDFSALFPETDPEPETMPDIGAEIAHLADYRPQAPSKHKTTDMRHVQIETKRSKPKLRRIGNSSTPGRKSPT